MVKIGLKRTNTKKGKSIVLEHTNEGCIVCTSHAPNQDGYIRLYNGVGILPRCIFLHRSAWEQVNGKVPEGYELDHICRNRRCCNPEHLQLLTKSQHKSKTNLERYAERIASIKIDLLANKPVKEIAIKHGVTVHTVNRYKRKLKGKYD